MKQILKITLFLCIPFLLHFSFLGFNFNKTDLIVHEWGTFTSTFAANGLAKSGQRLEGRTHLPKEVYSLVDTTLNRKEEFAKNYLKNTADSGYTAGGYSEGEAYHGISIENDTVRMETPVLYFYSPKELVVDVSVKFPQGSIGEWYPERSSGETISQDYIIKENGFRYDEENRKSKKSIDLKNYNGFISWQANILSPKANNNYTINTKANEWLAPRITDANQVKIGTEFEKYIFYRGIAGFEIPIQAKIKKDKKDKFLQISNTYSEKIPHLFVFNNPSNNPKTKSILWKGKLNSSENFELKLNQLDSKVFDESDINELKNALITEGLYQKEAESMINTWKKTYFDTRGITIFWIVPDSLINKLLPIEFSIMPDEFKRVFVGRIKIEN